VLRASSRALEKKAAFLVDGLHNISDTFEEDKMFRILIYLGNFVHNGFIPSAADAFGA
jgi:hypothetical protein